MTDAMISGLIVKGDLTLEVPDATPYIPKGWNRVRMAYRCLRGKPIYPSVGVSIVGNVFHGRGAVLDRKFNLDG